MLSRLRGGGGRARERYTGISFWYVACSVAGVSSLKNFRGLRVVVLKYSSLFRVCLSCDIPIYALTIVYVWSPSMRTRILVLMRMRM